MIHTFCAAALKLLVSSCFFLRVSAQGGDDGEQCLLSSFDSQNLNASTCSTILDGSSELMEVFTTCGSRLVPQFLDFGFCETGFIPIDHLDEYVVESAFFGIGVSLSLPLGYSLVFKLVWIVCRSQRSAWRCSFSTNTVCVYYQEPTQYLTSKGRKRSSYFSVFLVHKHKCHWALEA